MPDDSKPSAERPEHAPAGAAGLDALRLLLPGLMDPGRSDLDTIARARLGRALTDEEVASLRDIFDIELATPDARTAA